MELPQHRRSREGEATRRLQDLISNNGSHYSVYSSTVSHGIPYIFTATLDLYDPGPV